jgi:hypothetical protein
MSAKQARSKKWSERQKSLAAKAISDEQSEAL